MEKPTDTTNTATAQALTTPPGSGATLIAAERQRQMEVEGWTPEHDDTHAEGELCLAAEAYLHHARCRINRPGFEHEKDDLFPWIEEWWKPSDDQIRNLVKAGALIAAEIDRLQRLQNVKRDHGVKAEP